MFLKSFYSRLNLPILIFCFGMILLGFLQVSYAGKGGGKNICSRRALSTAVAPKITSLVATSPMRINVKSDFGFYDGMTLDYLAIKIYDDKGVLLNTFPDMIYSGDTSNLRDMSVEGLQPGHTYGIQVVDNSVSGGCVTPQAPILITMPALVSEAIAPDVQAPGLQAYSAYIGVYYMIQGKMNDNTGVSGVKISINGEVIREWSSDITVAPWFVHWNENVSTPSTQYDLGHIYQASIPQNVQGTTALVEVEVKDPFGNVTKKSSTLSLP